jgi:hypothetical protein
MDRIGLVWSWLDLDGGGFGLASHSIELASGWSGLDGAELEWI